MNKKDEEVERKAIEIINERSATLSTQVANDGLLYCVMLSLAKDLVMAQESRK